MTNRNFRCAHCGSATVPVTTNFINVKGDLFKVPVNLCTNEDCLINQGAKVTRNAKGRAPDQEYPPLRSHLE